MSDQFEQKPPMSLEGVKPETHEKEPPIKIWGEVTDPKEHDPKNFRYLVYAFNPLATVSQPLVAISAELSGAYEVDKTQGDQSINLFNQPEGLGERLSLSMSLIDQEHTGTWGEGGIVVDAPEENIIITSPVDTGSHSSSKEFLRKQAQDQSRLSGEQLLQSTSDGIYNEVVAFAKSESGETCSLKGLFIKVDKNGQPTNSVIAQKMRQHAARLNLPLVEIQVRGPYEQEKFETSANNIWAQYRDKRYNLGSDNPKWDFYRYSEGNTFSLFPPPQEIDEVLAHFVKCGDVTEEQAQQLKARYKIADTRRQIPKIDYDPETQQIKLVKFRENYDENETEYVLGAAGGCWKVNVKRFQEATIKKGLEPGRAWNSGDSRRYQSPLSGSQVLSVLESRKETTDPEEYKKLLGFFSGMKDRIDQVYSQLR